MFVDRFRSATAESCPELADAVALACKHKAVLVCDQSDRFTRDVVTGAVYREQLRKAGASLYFLAQGKQDLSSPEGALMSNIIDAMGQYERRKNAARQRLARQRLLASNKYPGGIAPIGFRRVGGNWCPTRRELEIVDRIHSAPAKGDDQCANCGEPQSRRNYSPSSQSLDQT